MIGVRCHELRIQDENRTWRIMYRVDANGIVLTEVFAKTSQATPATPTKKQSAATARIRRRHEGVTLDGTREAKTFGKGRLASWKHSGFPRTVGC